MDENPYRSPENPNEPARVRRRSRVIDAMVLAACMIGGACVAGWLCINPLDHDLSGAAFYAVCIVMGAIAGAVGWKVVVRPKSMEE